MNNLPGVTLRANTMPFLMETGFIEMLRVVAEFWDRPCQFFIISRELTHYSILTTFPVLPAFCHIDLFPEDTPWYVSTHFSSSHSILLSCPLVLSFFRSIVLSYRRLSCHRANISETQALRLYWCTCSYIAANNLMTINDHLMTINDSTL